MGAPALAAPTVVVTRCDVLLRTSSAPGPKLYQYRAMISVHNPNAAPAQFVRVDVNGLTRDGALSWAPVGAYFAYVPPHAANPRGGPSAGEPLILSRVMRDGLDPDRPTHGFHCQVRAAGAESPARPIDD